MKQIILPLFLCAFSAAHAQQYRLEKLWQTDTDTVVAYRLP